MKSEKEYVELEKKAIKEAFKELQHSLEVRIFELEKLKTLPADSLLEIKHRKAHAIDEMIRNERFMEKSEQIAA